MTRDERRRHVEGLRAKADQLRRSNDRLGAELILRAADEFEETYSWRRKKRRTVEWRE